MRKIEMDSEHPALPYEKLIIGKWLDDPEDFESIKKFGRTEMEFKENGELIYTAHNKDGKALVSVCTYRVEGNNLITDQPSAPNEVKSLIKFNTSNNLMINTDGFCSYMLREII